MRGSGEVLSPSPAQTGIPAGSCGSPGGSLGPGASLPDWQRWSVMNMGRNVLNIPADRAWNQQTAVSCLQSWTRARLEAIRVVHYGGSEVSLSQGLQLGQPHFLQQMQTEASDHKRPLRRRQQLLVFLLHQTAHVAGRRLHRVALAELPPIDLLPHRTEVRDMGAQKCDVTILLERLFLLMTEFEWGCVKSPVEREALSGCHSPEDLGLLNLQMCESGLHQSHLLPPHLQNKRQTSRLKQKHC